MKRTLFLTTLLVTTYSFSQKKLSAVSETQYDNNGGVINIDSSAFIYNSWQGSLNEHKPVFRYDGNIFIYSMGELFIHCDTTKKYYLPGSMPTVPTETIANTLLNGKITQANFGGGFARMLYEYNAQGDIIKETNEYLTSGWTVQDSLVRTYDALGNQLTHSFYNVASTTGLTLADSMWYEPGTNKLIKAVHYNTFAGQNLEISNQSNFTYLGNNIENLDYYEANGSGGIDWLYQIKYNFSGAVLNDFIAFEVFNDTPSVTSYAEGYFNYSAQNQPSSYTIILQGDTIGIEQWEYDSDGFILKNTRSEVDFNDVLYESTISRYYYQNTAGINESVLIDISLFPNPTSDILNIQAEGQLLSVAVYDISGKILIQQNTKKIDVNHLPKGNYVLKGRTSLGEFNKNFIVQ